MATATQTAPAVNTALTIEQGIAQNIERSNTGKSRSIEITVINVTNWKPTKTGLAVKMVITKDHGNYFPLASAITNLPASFNKPVMAKATLTQNGQFTNMNRLEFTGLQTAQLLAIREIGVGRALFASAADIQLAV